MNKALGVAALAVLLAFTSVALTPLTKAPETTPIPPPPHGTQPVSQTTSNLIIDGDVNRPLNLTYSELVSSPMVSEVVELTCVEGWSVTYNWTGIPLFYLLTLAEMRPDAYKVVTVCSDGYTSDLLVDEALNSSTILALQANGTSLPQLQYGPAGPNRLVVPGKLGYKWSSGVQEIRVVTTDYKGEWESAGYSDVADVPGYHGSPTLTPPLQTLTVPYQNTTFEVGALTNASLAMSSLNPSPKTLNLNVTVPAGASGFVDLIVQQNFLGRPYNVTVDGNIVNITEADTNTASYVYFTVQQGSHALSISATQFDIPENINYLTLILTLTPLLLLIKRRKLKTAKHARKANADST